jgi:hypothetical protein
MSTKIDSFITEVRSWPPLVAAAATDPKWLSEFEAMERGLNAIDRLADSSPAVIDIWDEIQEVIGRNDLSMKKRLLEVVRLATQARDTIKIVH